MNIQPISNNNNNVAMQGLPKDSNSNSLKNRIKQKILDAMPKATFDDSGNKVDIWEKVNDRLSRPAENRLLMGATALVLQPAIDASNKRVDEETRQISICRTVAKILAGTAVGIMVRTGAYKLVNNMTNLEGSSKYSKALIPKRIVSQLGSVSNTYKNALSTGIAIVAMCFTNFLLDAPLTVYLTNKFTDKVKQRSVKGAINEKTA